MEDVLIAYVDGSFTPKNPTKYGCGVLLIEPNGNEIEISYANSNPEAVKLRNVAGECSASMKAMAEAIEMGYKELIIYHDYTGVSAWITGEWQCKNGITKTYKEFYDKLIKDKLEVHFVKVKGHSGDEYNERVDKLAKKSLEI